MNETTSGRALRRVPRRARALIVLVALASAAIVVWTPQAAAMHTIFLDNACDVLVVPPAEPPAPEEPPVAPEPGVVEADAGSTIVLTADSLCDPDFDPATGELLAGNGITIETDDVTLDLNGFDIASSSDVAAAGDLAGVDVENAGVSVGGSGVLVTNTSSAVSLVDNFTANFDFKAENSSLVGGLLADGSFNLVGGNAHGGGAMAIDDSAGLLVDTVQLRDLSANGDNGIDLKFSSDVTIQNSSIEGILTGVRIRGTSGVTLANNTITGGCEAVESLKNLTEPVLLGNTLNEGANCPGAVEPPA